MLSWRSLLAASALAACSSTTEATRAATHGDDAGSAGSADTGSAAADVATAADVTAVVDAPTTPVDAPPRYDPNARCITGLSWTRGDRSRSLMNPGGACIACHTQRRENTGITLGGTLYYAPHEQDLCLGYTGDPPGSNTGAVRVHLVDADGNEAMLAPNASGNFSSTARFAFPLRLAEVIGPTGEINAMSAEVPHGDCNACHTRDGTTTPTGDAPGRIVVPF